jgi:hypothetical protein
MRSRLWEMSVSCSRGREDIDVAVDYERKRGYRDASRLIRPGPDGALILSRHVSVLGVRQPEIPRLGRARASRPPYFVAIRSANVS